MNLTSLGPSYTYIFVLLWFSLTTMSSSFTQVVAYVRISFLVCLHNSISFYVYITFCLFSHPTNENLMCFYLLAIVSNVAVTMSVQISFLNPCFQFFQVRAKLLDHMMILILWGPAIQFSTVASCSIPNSKAPGFKVLYILANTCYSLGFYCCCYCLFLLFVVATLISMKLHLTVVLTCISLMIHHVEHLFRCLMASLYLLWKNVYSSPLPILFYFLLFIYFNPYPKTKILLIFREWGRDGEREGEKHQLVASHTCPD